MDLPGHAHDDVGFMTALANEIAVAPDEVTASRQIAAAAASARLLARRPRALHWIAAATALVSVLGTGGVAMAGRLPDPIQTAVADVARVLPLPIDVPYPDVPSSAGMPPLDHPEIDAWDEAAPAGAIMDASPSKGPATGPEVGPVASASPAELRLERRDWFSQLRCDTDGERSPQTGEADSTCQEFVAPPGYDQDTDEIDQEHTWNKSGDLENRDRDSQENGSDELGGDDSDDRSHDETDRQEERHDHESPGDDSSAGGR